MNDKNKTKVRLLEEITVLRQRVIALEAAEAEQKTLEEEYKQTVEKLKTHHAILQSVLDSTTSAMFFLDRQYGYTSFNAAHAMIMKVIYGVEIEFGQSLLAYMTVSEDREHAKRNLDRALQGERFTEAAYSGEDALSRLYFEVTHTPVKDADGNIIGVAVFARDLTDRKRVEEALQASESKYRAMFQYMRSGVAVYEAVDNGDDFIFRDFNAAAERISRISRDHVIGQHLLRLFPNMDRFGLFAALQRVYRTGQPEHLPTAYYQDQTREGWRENFIYKLPSGEVVAIYDDVTERKRAEESLRESETQVRQLIENSPVAMVVSSGVKEQVILINKKFQQLFGYTIADIPDVSHWWPLAYPDEAYREMMKAAWIRKVEQAIKNHSQIEPVEARITCKDSSIRDIELHLSSIGEKNLVTFVDLTDRKRAEENIRQHTDLLENTIESLTHPFYVVDANDYTIVMANSAAQKLDDAAATCTCYALTHHTHSACMGSEHPCPLLEVKQTKKAVTIEHIHTDKNGHPRNVEIHAHPILDPAGNVRQMIEYTLDITERKRAEAEIQARVRQQAAVAGLGQRALMWNTTRSWNFCPIAMRSGCGRASVGKKG
jgi:PAS domain S-box-containing protein